MDDLKSIFENNNSELVEVPNGHELRFRQKLSRQLPNTKSRGLVISLIGYAAAASIGIVMFLSIVNTNKKIEEKIILASETLENIEAEVYLQKQVESRIEVIQLLDTNLKHTADLMKDISEFNSSLDGLEADLKEAPGDQRIVNAVLNTYLMKIETLDNIVCILQKFSSL